MFQAPHIKLGGRIALELQDNGNGPVLILAGPQFGEPNECCTDEFRRGGSVGSTRRHKLRPNPDELGREAVVIAFE